MARLLRFVLPGPPQHVIQRGNNREPIFYQEADYLFFLEKLAEACQKYNCDLHAYVLMTNHTHFLITPHTEDGIGKVMQGVGRYYVTPTNVPVPSGRGDIKLPCWILSNTCLPVCAILNSIQLGQEWLAIPGNIPGLAITIMLQE